jgi:hypothetical protein
MRQEKRSDLGPREAYALQAQLMGQALYRLLREERGRRRGDVVLALEYVIASRNDPGAVVDLSIRALRCEAMQGCVNCMQRQSADIRPHQHSGSNMISRTSRAHRHA